MNLPSTTSCLLSSLEWGAHLEELVLDLLHALEGQDMGGEGGHIVVGKLCVLFNTGLDGAWCPGWCRVEC